ncbi:MAG: phosphoglycerate kinase [Candidatus Omnitrophica bacterium]|nr:phosphoglycerate kinase [Candidatus Omnitrophota bacterium]MCM8793613.1 phosphoglycerate kinase [Candidatus Omnitrophota bacterium]
MKRSILKVVGLVVGVMLVVFSVANATLANNFVFRRIKSWAVPRVPAGMAFNLADYVTLAELPDNALKGKVVFVRPDFNEPTKDGKLLGDNRIKAGLKDIQYLISKGAKVVIGFHFGRPGGKVDPLLSTAPIAKRLGELLGKPVKFVDAAIGEKVRSAVAGLKEGEILMLENLRFYKGEQEDDDLNSFARELAVSTGAEVYVNIASGNLNSQHKKNPKKAEASMGPITHFIRGPHVIGNLVVEELKTLEEFMKGPAVLGVFGGIKVADKIGAIKNLLEKRKFKQLAFGGGMGTTFLAALGVNVGKSVYDSENVGIAKEILSLAAQKGVSVYLPLDVVLDDGSILNVLNAQGQKIADIPAERTIKTIGLKTTALYKELIAKEKNRLANGTMGQNEIPEFAGPDNEIADAFIDNPGNTLYIGGEGATSMINRLETRGIQGFSVGIKTLTAGGSALDALAGNPLLALDYIDSKVPIDWAKLDKERDVEKSLADLIGSDLQLSGGYSIEATSPTSMYGEIPKAGELYFNLKKPNGEIFALVKLRSARGNPTLVVTPVIKETASPEATARFYQDTVTSVMLLSQKTGRSIDLVMAKDDRFRNFIENMDLTNTRQPNPKIERREKDFSLGAIRGKNLLFGVPGVVKFLGVWSVNGGKEQTVAFHRSADPLAPTDATGTPLSLIIHPEAKRYIVNGGGTIGLKDLVALLDLGFYPEAVAMGTPDADAVTALRWGVDLITYEHVNTAESKKIADFQKAGLPVTKTLKDVLDTGIEVYVIDASPGGKEKGKPTTGEINKEFYGKYSNIKKGLFNGGEKETIADQSWAGILGNFAALLRAKWVRMVSCNTTGLNRVFGALYRAFGKRVEKFDTTLHRRSKDPGPGTGSTGEDFQFDIGPKYVPDLLSVPSSYISRNELQRLFGILNVDISLTPAEHYHVHEAIVKIKGASLEEVKRVLAEQPEIALVGMTPFSTGQIQKTLDSLIEDAHHPYVVISKVIQHGNYPDEFKIWTAVPQESDVIPDTIMAFLGMVGFSDYQGARYLVNSALWVDWLKQEIQKRLGGP